MAVVSITYKIKLSRETPVVKMVMLKGESGSGGGGGTENVIEVVQQNGTALPITNKTVNVTVPTDTLDLNNGAGYLSEGDITGGVTSGNAKLVNGGQVYTAIQGKQDSLTAGSGIDITDNIISATGGGGGVDSVTINVNFDIIGAGSSGEWSGATPAAIKNCWDNNGIISVLESGNDIIRAVGVYLTDEIVEVDCLYGPWIFAYYLYFDGSCTLDRHNYLSQPANLKDWNIDPAKFTESNPGVISSDMFESFKSFITGYNSSFPATTLWYEAENTDDNNGVTGKTCVSLTKFEILNDETNLLRRITLYMGDRVFVVQRRAGRGEVYEVSSN